MIIDGRAIARELFAETSEAVARLGRTPLVRAVVMDPTPATESYLLIKRAKAKEAGMELEVVRLSSNASQHAAESAASDDAADALIVQLPLPAIVDERAVLDAIPLSKDADVLSSLAYERFVNNEEGALLPPVVAAIAEVLERSSISAAGKRTVIVGNGRLVGAPAHVWLAREGADVTVLTAATFAEGKAALKEAELVVAGAGSPHLITPDMLMPGAVLMDAGTSESNGAIVGDFDPACADIASLFTPVPGGLGPVAVACLFKNAAKLLDR